MAILTALSRDELAVALGAFGLEVASVRGVLAGSVNTGFDVRDAQGGRWFVRVYEEQAEGGATREARLLARLAQAGVRTPPPRPRKDGVGFVSSVRGKPLCVFPFVEGSHRCQAQMTEQDTRAVGAALGRVHAVGLGLPAEEGLTTESRFSLAAIEARLRALDTSRLSSELAEARALLQDRALTLAPWQPRARQVPLVHGDLFRDNVLWNAEGLTLLDFESASRGGVAFDLAVTVLAWCYGDGIEPKLVAAMIDGYASERRLEPEEIEDVAPSAQLACIRFATTRITDYELRPRTSGVYKDYRRWLARLRAVEGVFGLREGPADSTLRSVWPR